MGRGRRVGSARRLEGREEVCSVGALNGDLRVIRTGRRSVRHQTGRIWSVDEMGRRGIEGIRFGVLKLRLWLLSLESGVGRRRGDCCNIDSLSGETFIDSIDGEAWNMVLEESSALSKEILDALCVPARGKGLSVSVLLMTDGTRGSTGGAARMLGIALGRASVEIAGGGDRRNLP